MATPARQRTINDGPGPAVAGTLALSVNEAGLDLLQDGADLAAGTVIGSNSFATSETAQSGAGNQLSFTAGSDAITSIALAVPNGANVPSVSGLAAGYTLSWSLSGGELIGTLFQGATNLGAAIHIGLAGTTTAAAGGTATPIITATLSDQLQHAAGSGNVVVGNISVVATDIDGSTVKGTAQLTVIDDVPTANAGAALTVTETDGATSGVNLLNNDVQGADGAKLTAVDIGSGLQTVASVGITTLSNAIGTYSFQADGTWSFDPNSGTATNANFTYQITDGDGDTSTAAQSIIISDGANPTVAGTLALTVSEAALDLTQSGADLAAATTTGSNPSATTETAQSGAGNQLTFTAGSDNITSIAFGSTGGINVSGAAAGSVFAWQVNGLGQLEGHLGSLAGPLAIVLALSGMLTANAGAAVTPTVTATLTDNFPHATGSGNISVTGIQILATDADTDTATANMSVTITDDVPSLGSITDGVVANVSGNHYDGTVGFTAGADQPHSFTLTPLTSVSGITYTTAAQLDGGSLITAKVGATTFFTVDLDASGAYHFDLVNARPTVTQTNALQNIAAGIYDSVTTGGATFDGLTFTSTGVTNFVDTQANGERLNVSGGGFGVGNANLNDNEGFMFGKSGADSLTFDVNFPGAAATVISWAAYNTGVTKPTAGDVPFQTGSFSLSDIGGNGVETTTINPTGTFDWIVVRFDHSGNFRVENFAYSSTVVPDNQAFSFGVAITDSDGDAVTGVGDIQTIDVQLLGGGATSVVTLNGTADNETLVGGPLNDTLNGLGGNDTLFGLAGNDIFDGGAGNDILIGGAGKNTLTGGANNDTFQFDSSALDGAALQDIIADFNTSQDMLEFESSLFTVAAGQSL
ncbi:MAG: Ig-like domain-containing protein, partial [Pseudomonadota bacterium]